MPETSPHTVTIAKQRFELRRDRVERMLRGVLPEPISTHYVVIGARRYPPKQVIGVVTGIDRADFTTHQARRVLMGLGFAVGRRPSGAADMLGRVRVDAPVDAPGARSRRAAQSANHVAAAPCPPSPRHAAATVLAPISAPDRERELAEALCPLRGEWVAIKDGELLVAAPTPKELVGWLARHDRRADSMFRVPEDELALAGLAPL